MTTLTTKELAIKLAGGDSYIRTKDNNVKGLAITFKNNPQAPEVILVGTGPRIKKSAQLFLNEGTFKPVYIKEETNSWKFYGNYKAIRYDTNRATIKKHHQERALESIHGVLFLEEEKTIDTNISPDSKHRKKVENAAIQFVTLLYEKKGYTVTDLQKENVGYDLKITKKHTTLRVEVKGTASEKQRFILTRNEHRKSAHPQWRLALITNALHEPEMNIFKDHEVRSIFNLDPLAWECTKKNTK